MIIVQTKIARRQLAKFSAPVSISSQRRPNDTLSSRNRQADILVAGAGAPAFRRRLLSRRRDFRLSAWAMSIEARTGRTVALFEASLRFYKALGVWPHFRGKTAPLAKIIMIDATGARFPVPSVSFAASEIGLAAFGENIENNVLVEGLAEIAAATKNLVLHEGMIGDISFDEDAVRATLANGQRVTAKLAAAADGRMSPARTKAGIGTRSWTYPQIAFTALLSHAKPHRNISTEFHTRSGPCTLVPLRPAGDKPNRSSLVWLMSPEAAERRRALSQLRAGARDRRSSRLASGQNRDRWAGRLFPHGGDERQSSCWPSHRARWRSRAYLSAARRARPKPQSCGTAPPSSKFWRTRARSGTTSAPRGR